MGPEPQHRTLGEQFRDPPGEFWPVPLWWWSGEPVVAERLCWQLDQLAAGGVRAVVIMNLAPSGPSFGCPADDPPWFSEHWWKLFVLTCEHARALRMRVWFYDQLGFSAANVQGQVVNQHPDCVGETIERLVVDTEEACELSAPAGSRPVAAAALPLDADGTIVGPPVALNLERGRARFPGGGRHRVLLAYARPKGFDYLSVAACRRLIDAVHGEFERRVPHLLGRVIAGSFQDELPAIGTWTTGFLHAFDEQHSYELGPVIAALWEDWGPESAKVRVEYHATRTALAEDAFFRPLAQWHARHGMLQGCDQQSPARAGHPVEGAQLYADYPATHRWFSAPGSDHHGDAKIHSSLAHLHGGQRVWLEGFHSSGWGGTLEETFDWLLPWIRAGVTLYNPHAVYYTARRGWFEWAPPSTCWRQPYWRHYSIFARTVARLCAVLAQGTHCCDTAVVYPSSTVHAHLTVDQPVAPAGRPGGEPPVTARTPAHDAQDTYLALVGRMRWFDPQPGVLDADRRDFDVVDERSLATATVADGKLQVAGEAYRAVVLPETTVLDTDAAATLLRFADHDGVVVIVGRPPHTAAGRAAHDNPVRVLAAHRSVRHVVGPEDVPAALADLDRPVDAPVPTLLRRVDDHHVLFVPAAHPGATDGRITFGDIVLDYDFDPGRYTRTMPVRVRGIPGEPALWDPVTGATIQLDCRDLGDGVRQVEVPFENGPAALVVFDPAASPLPVTQPRRHPTEIIPLDGDWTSDPIPTLDPTHHDLDPSGPAQATLAISSLLHRPDPDDQGLAQAWYEDRGRDGWASVRATFGSHGLFTGPTPVGELPDPLPSLHANIDEPDSSPWQAIIYSDSRGIDRDPSHWVQLGPKGYVPEEFFALPLPPDGAGVQFRAVVTTDREGAAHLAVGAPAHKQVWWNGQPLGPDPGGYLGLTPVQVDKGPNLLEIRFTQSQPSTVPLPQELHALRGHWALVTDPDAYQRPEWITAAEPPQPGTTLLARGELHLDQATPQARLLVASAGVARVTVNGHHTARLTERGFYESTMGDMPAAFVHHIGHLLRAGDNSIEVAIDDHGRKTPILVDIDLGNGATWSTSHHWTISRDGKPAPLQLAACHWFDPRTWHVTPRPHPLPATAWLNGKPQHPTVIPVTASPDALDSTIEWFRFDLPPGATRIQLPVHGQPQAWIDRQPVDIDHGSITLERGGPPRTCTVRVVTARGARWGAAWRDLPSVDMGPGRICLGDWQTQGLRAWSGGIAYRRTIDLTADQASYPITLDLGAVRGTIEVHLNGKLVQQRVFSPWTTDLTGHVTPGANELEVRVFGTLGPHLHHTSPTSYVLHTQRRTGWLGPAHLLTSRPT